MAVVVVIMIDPKGEFHASISAEDVNGTSAAKQANEALEYLNKVLKLIE